MMTNASRPSPDAFSDKSKTTFTIQAPDAGEVTALLHTVDLPAEQRAGAGRTILYFDVPAHRDLKEGIYRVSHPRIRSFRARFERVQAGGQRTDKFGYLAIFAE